MRKTRTYGALDGSPSRQLAQSASQLKTLSKFAEVIHLNRLHSVIFGQSRSDSR